MNILFYNWNAYNLLDTKWAFEQKGFTVTMLKEPIENPEEDTEYIHKLTRQLSMDSYAFVFSLNYFPVLAEGCHQVGTPYVCWNCDGSLLAMYHMSIFYPTNVIFTFDYKNYKEFQALGVKNIYHLPLAVNTHRLEKQLSSHCLPHNINISIKGNDTFPISFVGNLYEENTYQQIKDNLPDYLAGYLRGAINAQKHISGGNMLEVLLTDEIVEALEELSYYHKSDQSFAGIKQLFASTILGFQTASEERRENLTALGMRFSGVHLFTQSRAKDISPVIVHPPVDYQREMPVIFQRSRINLNMTIPNITTGIPLRIWDILGCGGFLLTNYQPELDNYFEPGKQLDIFEESGELLEKTNFYLKHDALRTQIARDGQALVAAEHNYLVRTSQLLKVLKELYII